MHRDSGVVTSCYRVLLSVIFHMALYTLLKALGYTSRLQKGITLVLFSDSVLRKKKTKLKTVSRLEKENIFSVKGKCDIFGTPKPLLQFVSFHCDNLVLFLVGNNYTAITMIMPN